MCEALDDYEGSFSIGGRLIANFRFADGIVVNAAEGEEADVLVDHTDATTTRYKMSRDMTKPTKWECGQRRLKSARASAQSDQSLRCALNG